MIAFFAWIENSALSIWVRESPSMWAFPFILILHTIGMAFLVGPNLALNLRVLGVGSGIPLSLMQRVFPIMRLGFVVNAVSGLLLLIAYPTKALTNPVFYLKLLLIAVALAEATAISRRFLQNPTLESGTAPRTARILAGSSIFVWFAAITAGRLLAYTFSQMMATGE